MNDEESHSEISSIAGLFGGLFLAAQISDSLGGNRVTFVLSWIVCGFVLFGVVETIMNLFSGSPGESGSDTVNRSTTKEEWKQKSREDRMRGKSANAETPTNDPQ